MAVPGSDALQFIFHDGEREIVVSSREQFYKWLEVLPDLPAVKEACAVFSIKDSAYCATLRLYYLKFLAYRLFNHYPPNYSELTSGEGNLWEACDEDFCAHMNNVTHLLSSEIVSRLHLVEFFLRCLNQQEKLTKEERLTIEDFCTRVNLRALESAAIESRLQRDPPIEYLKKLMKGMSRGYTIKILEGKVKTITKINELRELLDEVVKNQDYDDLVAQFFLQSFLRTIQKLELNRQVCAQYFIVRLTNPDQWTQDDLEFLGGVSADSPSPLCLFTDDQGAEQLSTIQTPEEGMSFILRLCRNKYSLPNDVVRDLVSECQKWVDLELIEAALRLKAKPKAELNVSSIPIVPQAVKPTREPTRAASAPETRSAVPPLKGVIAPRRGKKPETEEWESLSQTYHPGWGGGSFGYRNK